MKSLQHLTFKSIYAARYLLLISSVLAAFLTWLLGNPVATGPMAALFVFGGNALRTRYLDSLDRRVAAVDGPVWDVELNQVKVGTINDAEYAAIRRMCFTDHRLSAAQLMNALRVMLNAFDYCYRAIPIGLFWIGVALAIFSPETIGSALAAVQHASPSDMSSAVAMAGRLLAVLMIVSVGFHWVLGLSRFGFINRFDEAIGTAVRKHCGVPAVGSIVLVRWAEGSPVFTNEMGFVQRRR